MHVFDWTTQITFTCIGSDRTNGGVKFCILSQSIPWSFSDPSLLQTVQLVLLTKANVKGLIEDYCQLWICSVEPELLSSQKNDIGQGDGPSDWAMVRGRIHKNRPRISRLLNMSLMRWFSFHKRGGTVMDVWFLPLSNATMFNMMFYVRM